MDKDTIINSASVKKIKWDISGAEAWKINWEAAIKIMKLMIMRWIKAEITIVNIPK